MRIDVLGVGFDNLTMEEALAAGMEHIRRRSRAIVVTPNPEIVMAAREDPELRELLEQAELVLPDGIGIIHGARILGTPLREKLPGVDFADRLMARLGKEGGSVYLLGAKPGVAELAAQRLAAKHPGLRIAGTHHGYFQEDGPVVEAVNAARPDLLLVCLGCPKQEKWMFRHRAELDVGLMAGLGGSLDVFAGVVRRAPPVFQKLGLEWFYRLCREPRRIGRMMKLPAFLALVVARRGAREK